MCIPVHPHTPTHTPTPTRTHTHIQYSYFINNKLYQLKQIKHLLNRTSFNIKTSAYIISKLDYYLYLYYKKKRLNKVINLTCRLILKLL